MSVRITVTIEAQVESGYIGTPFVNASSRRLVLPEVEGGKDVGLDAMERLQLALQQVAEDTLRESQQQARSYAEHTHTKVKEATI